MAAILVEIEKKQRPANSLLTRDGNERQKSDINNSPLFKGYLNAMANSQATNLTYTSVTATGDTPTTFTNTTTNAMSSASIKKHRNNQPDTSIFKNSKLDGAF
jgi:hypothetical protein